MKQTIPIANILDCGVWHKSAGKRSTLNEAVAALGEDCIIINGNAFTMTDPAKPNDAYTINSVIHMAGGYPFGYSLGNGKIEFSYLNSVGLPCFIGAFESVLKDGIINTPPPGGTTQHTVLGLTPEDIYINVHTTPIDGMAAMRQASAAGCTTAINLDGGGSSQYYLPGGERYATGRPVLNWVWFKLKTEKKEEEKSDMKILIDAGHGGKDPGAVNGQTYEKDIALAVALNIGTKLAAHGFIVEYTRTSDKDVTLNERVAQEKKSGVKLYLSIHADGNENKTANGITSYVIAFGGNAEKAAKQIQTALIAATTAYNRGVRTANYQVLRETIAPAVLVELGFVTNDTEAVKLTNPEYQDLLARAITQGICLNYGVTYNPVPGVRPVEKYITVDELKKLGYGGITF